MLKPNSPNQSISFGQRQVQADQPQLFLFWHSNTACAFAGLPRASNIIQLLVLPQLWRWGWPPPGQCPDLFCSPSHAAPSPHVRPFACSLSLSLWPQSSCFCSSSLLISSACFHLSCTQIRPQTFQGCEIVPKHTAQDAVYAWNFPSRSYACLSAVLRQ